MKQKKESSSPIILLGPMIRSHRIYSSWLRRRFKKDSCLVIAVDGGLDHASILGLLPDQAVGDWDSLKNKKLLKSFKEKYVTHLESEKDHSDYFHALKLALKSKATEVIAVGFLGGRSDHQFSVLHESLSWSQKTGKQITLLGLRECWVSFRGKFNSRKGKSKSSCFSIFNGGHGKSKVSIIGAKYSGRSIQLDTSSKGLSNLFLDEELEIVSKDQALLLCFSRMII